MPAAKLKALTILNSDGTGAVQQLQEIINKLNVQVELSGGEDHPSELALEVTVQEPTKRRSGMSSTGKTMSLAAKKQAGSGPPVYKASLGIKDLFGFLKTDDMPEVATLARAGGTSDAKFRNPLLAKGWAHRGAGRQPGFGKAGAIPATGDKMKEEPDGRLLMAAGGVEVVEVKLPDQEGLKFGTKNKAWAFVRSPADVFFYTGHGAWWNGALLHEYAYHKYQDWMSPAELLNYWKKHKDVGKSPMDLDVLFINGCSVLYWDMSSTVALASSDYDNRGSHALDWAQLLCSKDGPLIAVCSYRASAPLDDPWGNKIGEEMGYAIANGLGTNWGEYPRKWLEINAKYGATRIAAAISTKGYWYLNHPDLPGYDKKKKDFEVMGPVPMA